MADQDDDWRPDKLATLLGALGDAQLVYSDQRVISPPGELVADTYWSTRRNNHTDITSLLVANSVTGAASLFPRAAARRRAAVPARPVRPLPRPLDRPGRPVARRHRLRRPAAVRLRAARRRRARPRGRQPRDGPARPPRPAGRRPARADRPVADALLRGQPAPGPAGRDARDARGRPDRAGEAAGACPRSPPPTTRCWRWARLAARAVPELAGRRPETLGAEVGLSLAYLWRGLLRASARGDRPRADAAAGLGTAAEPGAAARPQGPGCRIGAHRGRQDRAAGAGRARRRPRPGQPAGPHDRPASTCSAATSPSSTWPAGWPSAATASGS